MTGDTLGGSSRPCATTWRRSVGQDALTIADLKRIMERALVGNTAPIRRSRWRCSTSRAGAEPASDRSDRTERRSACAADVAPGQSTPDHDIDERAPGGPRLSSVQAQDRREADRSEIAAALAIRAQALGAKTPLCPCHGGLTLAMQRRYVERTREAS